MKTKTKNKKGTNIILCKVAAMHPSLMQRPNAFLLKTLS